MAIGIRGFAAIIAVAALMVIGLACGNGAEPTSLSEKDYVSLVDSLRAVGATVDPAGTGSADYFAPQEQLLTVNGVRVKTFEFASAEAADAAAEGVSANGSSIVMTMADGTQKASMVTWVTPPHFYKAGKLIVLYVGCDSDVIDALRETMGPQFAGGAGVSQCPDRVPPTTMEISQALEAASGSEVTVSGFLIADKDGNTRLCSVLLESDPPQCGGDRIDLLGFDASSVPNSKTPQRPSEIQTARWTDSYITVTGIKGIDGLAEVQLSTESLPPAPGGQLVPAGMGMIAPNLRLTFDGAEYTGVEILGAASPNGPIVCCGTPIDMDDMEVIGTGILHNSDDDATVQLYRPKANGTTDVYTFHPAQTRSKVEGAPPADEADTTPGTWVRWIAK